MDFKNTIIILTSNLGSSYPARGLKPDGSISDEAQEAVRAELRQAFRPEFLNRLDEIIMFRPLTRENLSGIIDIMVEGLRKRLADKNLSLEISDAAKALIIERGYDPLYGARPLRRYLQSSAETLIAREILSGDLSAGGTLVLDAGGRRAELPGEVNTGRPPASRDAKTPPAVPEAFCALAGGYGGAQRAFS